MGFGCKICGKCYQTKLNLENHIRAHNGERPFKCDSCHKDFVQLAGIACHKCKHENELREKRYSCSVCLRKYLTASGCANHIKINHSDANPYKCPICCKQCLGKGPLEDHMRKHTGEKPFQCSMCKKRFAVKYNLACHMHSIHLKRTPFPCSKCTKSCNSVYSLRRHVEGVHERMTRFSCLICNDQKQFFDKEQLYRHMSHQHTHERPYSCVLCGREFLTSGKINNHTRRHTGERPYKCEGCGLRFFLRTCLKSHILRHHKDKRQ